MGRWTLNKDGILTARGRPERGQRRESQVSYNEAERKTTRNL